MGVSPTRRRRQPESTGAGMEVTKCLKPSVYAAIPAAMGEGSSRSALAF